MWHLWWKSGFIKVHTAGSGDLKVKGAVPVRANSRQTLLILISTVTFYLTMPAMHKGMNFEIHGQQWCHSNILIHYYNIIRHAVFWINV